MGEEHGVGVDVTGEQLAGRDEGVGIVGAVDPGEDVGEPLDERIVGEAVPDGRYGLSKLFSKRPVCLFEMVLESSSEFEAAVVVSSCSSLFRASN